MLNTLKKALKSLLGGNARSVTVTIETKESGKAKNSGQRREKTRDKNRDCVVWTPPEIRLRVQYTSAPQDRFIKSNACKDTFLSGDGNPIFSAKSRGNHAFSYPRAGNIPSFSPVNITTSAVCIRDSIVPKTHTWAALFIGRRIATPEIASAKNARTSFKSNTKPVAATQSDKSAIARHTWTESASSRLNAGLKYISPPSTICTIVRIKSCPQRAYSKSNIAALSRSIQSSNTFSIARPTFVIVPGRALEKSASMPRAANAISIR